MCLAVPMKLTKKEEFFGVAELGGIKREVNIMLVPDVKVGDYVIIHTGFAIEILDESEALKTIELFKELLGEDL